MHRQLSILIVCVKYIMGRQICCVVGFDRKDDINLFSFQDRFNMIHVFNSPTSEKPYFYIVFICFEKFFSYFRHYWVTYNGNSSLPLFYICDFTINLHRTDTFVWFVWFWFERSIWSACSSYVLRFKKFVCFSFKFPAIVLVDFRCKLPFHKCYYCSFYFCCYCYHCSCFYSYCYWCCN